MKGCRVMDERKRDEGMEGVNVGPEEPMSGYVPAAQIT